MWPAGRTQREHSTLDLELMGRIKLQFEFVERPAGAIGVDTLYIRPISAPPDEALSKSYQLVRRHGMFIAAYRSCAVSALFLRASPVGQLDLAPPALESNNRR